MSGITYKDAGVDIEAADRFVDRVRALSASTQRPEVLAGIGGFAGMFRLPAGLREPVLVACTDGVGTKLELAERAGAHHAVGVDVVAMCVNDLVCCGAEPLVFLDYLATGRLEPEASLALLEGITAACRESGCALLGGETAEMPGFYPPGRFDVAGFAVGAVEREAIVDGKGARPGDVLVALASSGPHSNGFSLIRRILERAPDAASLDELLVPTRLYVRAARAALAATAPGDVRAIAHITGGGLPGNLPRVLPAGLTARIDGASWAIPDVFGRLQAAGEVPTDDLRRTFNLGVGLVLAAAPRAVGAVLEAAAGAGDTAWVLGDLVEGAGGVAWPEASP